MSVDSNLFVTCGKDKTIEVGQAVRKALDVWITKSLDTYWQNHTDAVNRIQFLRDEDYRAQSEVYTNGVKSVDTHEFRHYTFHFGCGDRNARMLSMFIDFSCDYSDIYGGDKIIFSIGCWGMYDEIMKVVAKAVAPFGDVYYDFNDCDDKDFIKLED